MTVHTQRHRRILDRPRAQGNGLRAAVVGALLCCLALAPGAQASKPSRKFDLYYDAVFKSGGLTDKAPAGDSVGDVQHATGDLIAAGGHRQGTFSFRCVYVSVPAGDPHERCSGWSKTADGRIDYAGPAVKSDADHTWKLLRGSGRLKGVKGSLVVHDVGDLESLATATLMLPHPQSLRSGVITRPASNAHFVRRATAVCTTTHDALAKLPPFPFDDFDALNPDPARLPDVGRFFTGAGDPRPAWRDQIAKLDGLGRPPGQRGVWRHYVRSVKAQLATAEALDQAALATDVPGFVATVHMLDSVLHKQAVAATLFGAYNCR